MNIHSYHQCAKDLLPIFFEGPNNFINHITGHDYNLYAKLLRPIVLLPTIVSWRCGVHAFLCPPKGKWLSSVLIYLEIILEILINMEKHPLHIDI